MAAVKMHSEDTSTSSEDETSATGMISDMATADGMCRVEINSGEKKLFCTGCGYSSDRRANVTRHYQRIHGELPRSKKCTICGKEFQSKWNFYIHCQELHPNHRQSWFTTTNVYKLNQASNIKTSKMRVPTIVNDPVPSSDHTKQEFVRLTRASVRKLNPEEKPATTVKDSSMDDGTESSIDKDNISDEPTSPESSIGNANTDENSSADLSNLPIKKRYMRRIVYENRNDDLRVVFNTSDGNNNEDPTLRGMIFQTWTQRQREFLRDIDFDELNAILTLRDMQRNR